MTFPVLAGVDVYRLPYTGTTNDGLGNTVPQFGTPQAVQVYQISPHISEHGTGTDTETKLADLDVYMPKITVDVKDQFTVGGDTFDVVKIDDWTQGFHGWAPGIVVQLQKVT